MTDFEFSRERLLGEEKKEGFGLIDILLIFLLVFMIANLFVQNFILSPVMVDGNSMNLTLNDEDWLYMSKIKEPERGDVVVFEKSEGVNYIKRIIALEGDELYGDSEGIHLKKNGETEWQIIEDEHAYYYQDPNLPKANPTFTYIPLTVVGKGEMFVLGDNRNDSTDSRRIGLVKTGSILGIVPEWAIEHKDKYSGYLRFVDRINEFMKKLKNG